MKQNRILLAAACVAALLAAASGCDVLESDPPNDPPVVSATTITPATVRPESLAIASVLAGDPEGGALGYAWSASAGSFPEGAAAASVAWRAPSTEGPCTLSVEVDDGRAAATGTAVAFVAVGGAVLAASPDTLDFGSDLSSLPLTIANPGTGRLSWLAAPQSGWIGVDPAGGYVEAGAAAIVTVTVDRHGGHAGETFGHVYLTTNAGFDTIHVRAEIAADPRLWVQPAGLHFGLAATRIPIEIRNTGNGGMVSWTAEVSALQPWLSLSAGSGMTADETDTLWAQADRTGLPLYRDSFAQVTIRDAGNDTRTLLFRTNHVSEPVRGYAEVARYPHDPTAFTQGLEWHDGALIEGTGLYGRSQLRRVELATGAVLESRELRPEFFGEGVTVWNDTVIQLTWRAHKAFTWSVGALALQDSFSYATEGWGLTHDDARLIMSDGSRRLVFRTPGTFQPIGEVEVTASDTTVANLNELEWIDGYVWANVWLTDYIARIDPATGRVEDWLDLTGLLPAEYDATANVLNGIAYDAASDRLFVTGKEWPLLFEIRPVALD
jgi:glutamine cyclotransferase